MEGFKRVRLADASEAFHESAQEYNAMVCAYKITFSSKEIVSEMDVREAALYLHRKVPILQLCLRYDEEELWFCEMKEEKIEFEVSQDEFSMDKLHEIYNRRFDSSNGPLWRVNFFPSKAKEGEKYLFDIVLALHHGITDGHTSFRLCQHFHNILNDIIAKNPINKTEIGFFADGRETKELVEKRLSELKQQPELFQAIQDEMKELASIEELLTKAYPMKNPPKPSTRHLWRELSREDTERLVALFKEEGVSFHVGFCSVINWALVELLQEADLHQDSYDIFALHAVNIRRYWKGDTDNAFGCHVGCIRLSVKTPCDLHNHFWEYAKALNLKLKTALNGTRVLDEMTVFPFVSKPGKTGVEESCKSLFPSQLSYTTSNMGDISKIVPGNGEHVQIESLLRGISLHVWNFTMSNSFQTYKGRLHYGMDYSTTFISDALAEKILEKIFNKISKLTKSC